MSSPLEIVLLIVSWITALVTLVIFLESWFALTRKSRLGALNPGPDSGRVTVLVPLRGDRDAVRRTLDSLLAQSYPFVEVVLPYCEYDPEDRALVREYSSAHGRIPIRPVGVHFRLDSATERIRAMEQAHVGIRGEWILVLDSDVVLEPHAIGSAVAFVREKDITAFGLTPGVKCRSFVQRLVAPSLEWFVRMMSVVDRGREQSNRFHPAAPFMLFHGDTHAVVNRMNRMPGILNEAGWTLWSYRIEGLRTFYGDGSGWIFRDATPRSLLSGLQPSSRGRRIPAFLVGSAAIAVVSVFGVTYGWLGGGESLVTHGILYLSAFSYSLMATSYFFYSRRLRAATWFSPLWFLAHGWALLLVVGELGRSKTSSLHTAVHSSRGSDSEVSTRR